MFYWPSHKGYASLRTRVDGLQYNYFRVPSKKTHLAIIMTFLVLLSGALNIFQLCKTNARSHTTLDRYQHLNIQSLVNEEIMRSLQTSFVSADPTKHAIVTTLYTDSYATAIATLGHSLRRVNTTARLIVLYIPAQVSLAALCIATSTGFSAHAVQRIPPPANSHPFARFVDQYTKLRLWGLDSELGLEAVVYMDADTLARRNFDELFSLPWNFAAVPDVTMGRDAFGLKINAGMLFLRPFSAVLEDMLKEIGEAYYKTVDAEQSFLNTYYAKDVVRLPYAYNANLAIKVRSPAMWTGLMQSRTALAGVDAGVVAEARIVHYTLVKPFLAERENTGKVVVAMEDLATNVRRRMLEWGGLFISELQEWLDVWEEAYGLYGKEMRECRAAGKPL